MTQFTHVRRSGPSPATAYLVPVEEIRLPDVYQTLMVLCDTEESRPHVLTSEDAASLIEVWSLAVDLLAHARSTAAAAAERLQRHPSPVSAATHPRAA